MKKEFSQYSLSIRPYDKYKFQQLVAMKDFLDLAVEKGFSFIQFDV